MININPIDRESILRCLGTADVPDDVVEMYGSVLRIYHTMETGPLGPAIIALMLHQLGYCGKTIRREEDKPTEWRDVERGEKVRVRRAGEWAEEPWEFYNYIGAGELELRNTETESKQLFRVVDCELVAEDWGTIDKESMLRDADFVESGRSKDVRLSELTDIESVPRKFSEGDSVMVGDGMDDGVFVRYEGDMAVCEVYGKEIKIHSSSVIGS